MKTLLIATLYAASTATISPSTPLITELLPAAQALTLAQTRVGHGVATLLVIELDAAHVRAVDLSAASGLHTTNPFALFAHFGRPGLKSLADSQKHIVRVAHADLLPMGPPGQQHIAAATNYPEHRDEVDGEDVFLFPKRAPAISANTPVLTSEGMLLDYEVEICARFDRNLRSMADFEQATVGLFLCGDFTDRALMVRHANVQNIASADGFADSKSGADRFPSGSLLVLPRDWRSFVRDTVIATEVNAERRQHTIGADMIKPLDALVSEALQTGGAARWLLGGARIPLLDADRGIETGTAIFTGTGAGVAFQPPPARDIAELLSGDALDPQAMQRVFDNWTKAARSSGRYLQPGDQVRYTSNRLGAMVVNIQVADD